MAVTSVLHNLIIKGVEALRPFLEEELSSWGEHGKMLREVADKANTESR
jgi:hypothetical protein